jgi:hypothetical protein
MIQKQMVTGPISNLSLTSSWRGVVQDSGTSRITFKKDSVHAFKFI